MVPSSTPQRAKAQRMLNEALALIALEELSTMVLPVQPVREWQAPANLQEGELRIPPGQMWRKHIRDDVSAPIFTGSGFCACSADLERSGVADRLADACSGGFRDCL